MKASRALFHHLSTENHHCKWINRIPLVEVARNGSRGKGSSQNETLPVLLTDVVKRLECKDPSTPQYGVIMITAITSYQNIDYNKKSWHNLVGRCTVKSKSI